MAHIAASIPLVSIETSTHSIEISEGCLTIGEHTFPDNCVSLSQEETEEVLKLLRATLETKPD